MTDIAFHTGIGNPLDYACRLLRKAYRSGARVAVHRHPRTRPVRLAQQPARVIQRIRDAGVEGDVSQGLTWRAT